MSTDEHRVYLRGVGTMRAELERAYRALHGFYHAHKQGKLLDKTALAYHSATIGAAARFIHEGSLDGAAYFEGKPVSVLHKALRPSSVETPMEASTGNRKYLREEDCEDNDEGA